MTDGDSGYRYAHFKRQVFFEDLAFRGGPAPGDPMPDFDVPTVDGERIRKSEHVGSKPLLLLFASITCPLAASAVPLLKRLHEEFGERVRFVTLYVREAHPGEHYPQPETFERKLRHARDYRRRHQIPWPVAVDSLEGQLHRGLDPRSTAAYLMDADGHVAFRVLCSNDYRALREGLGALTAARHPWAADRERLLIPLLRGMGEMDRTLTVAGRQGRQDLLHEMPLAYGMVRLAGRFPALPPLGRAIAATLTAAAGLIVLGGLGRGLIRGRDAKHYFERRGRGHV